MFRRARAAQTRKLTEAACSLKMSPPRSKGKRLAMMGLPAVLVLSLGLFHFSSEASSANSQPSERRLRRENERLNQALKQAELLVSHETATRESIEKLLAEQSEEIKRLRGELAFFEKNRKTQAGRK